MTQDEIIRMAREAGLIRQRGNLDIVKHSITQMERFADLVAAHEREKHNSPSWETVDDAIAAEREACAKVCETEWSTLGQMEASSVFAAAIRARSNNGSH